MNDCGAYIDQAKKRLHLAHDSLLADYLEIRPTTLATMRKNGFSDRIAIRVAEIIGGDPGELLLIAKLQREKDAEVKSALLAYAKKVIAPAVGYHGVPGPLLPNSGERRKLGL